MAPPPALVRRRADKSSFLLLVPHFIMIFLPSSLACLRRPSSPEWMTYNLIKDTPTSSSSVARTAQQQHWLGKAAQNRRSVTTMTTIMLNGNDNDFLTHPQSVNFVPFLFLEIELDRFSVSYQANSISWDWGTNATTGKEENFLLIAELNLEYI